MKVTDVPILCSMVAMLLGRQAPKCGRPRGRQNRSPKGNMWSAIPVALLCMIVYLSEGKQGSGPEGDEVL